MQSLHRTRLRGVRVSCACVGAAGCFPSPNDMTEPSDAPISDCGLGPAWSIPSCRTATARDGDAAARSSSSRIVGCKPSPRAAANVLNLSDEVISRTPVPCDWALNLNERQRVIAPFLTFQLNLCHQAPRDGRRLQSDEQHRSPWIFQFRTNCRSCALQSELC